MTGPIEAADSIAQAGWKMSRKKRTFPHQKWEQVPFDSCGKLAVIRLLATDSIT
ncbi:hypothetical protein PV433_01965 [Paenibacillus sp. GYB004]|uniref:hypothetical protein n=1 Tax=Paenibacillus sp. GYB004 TaxID=2994393 RepID=UPI002F9658FD